MPDSKVPRPNLTADFQTRYGPWALVVGASEGLGAEFSTQLAEKGLNLVLVARRAEKLKELADQLTTQFGVQVRCLPLDLAQNESAFRLLEATQDFDIGTLIYNAAYSTIGLFWEHPLEDHLTEVEVNCRTPLILTYTFVQRLMRRKSGCLILMSSLSASLGCAYISNYAATKAYNLLLAEGIAEELRGSGIDVLACCPGATNTPNYIASLSQGGRNRSVSAMDMHDVVSETLGALGKQYSYIPGRVNRLSAFIMRRVLPRKASIHLMGRVLRGLYPP